MRNEQIDGFSEDQQEVLKSIRISRIILPILIGVGVVIYLLIQQFDQAAFDEINWTRHTLFWVSLSFLLLVIRHIAYANRLRVLSNKEFGWRKCIELIFIWEFSSAVSPTSVGGSAVALFVLAQEKLPTAKTTAIVIYTAILDTIFFVGTLPILFGLFGPNIIRPNLTNLGDLDGWGYTFIGAYLLMATYGVLFFYGLFINPNQLKRFFEWCTSFGFLKKYQKNATKLGIDLMVASSEMKREKWPFHIAAFLSTATAWSCRFLLLNCLIIAIVDTTLIDLFTQAKLYSRLETMFVIMAFSPTPGGAGFAEIVFGGFLSDYVPVGISLIVAFMWRGLTYYAYLLAGVIIVPNWVRKLLNRRKKKKMEHA
ncbi:MAG: lysylphosphatidylglycerol synthase transmembrane domain-containing protein [Bacteroidota bacterium]